MSSLAQLPPSHTLNQTQKPLEQWNSDELIRTYLRSSTEPMAPADPVLLRTRLQMFRVRMFEIERLRLNLRPASSDVFDRELAAIMYKRKILLWFSFPIRDLPDEILTIIFRYVVWSSNGADQATQHRLWLTWVCRRFRAIALSDATLWNSVWFRDSPPWTRSFTFIERANTATLDLRIDEKIGPEGTAHDAPPKYPPITVPQIKELLKILGPKVGQIRILVVVLSDMEVVEAFMEGLSKAGPLSAMERIEVHRTSQPYLWPKDKSEGSGGHLPLSEQPTPKLRWLSLNGVTTNWNALQPSNLRTIDLRRMSVQACPTSERWSEILKLSPDLFKLSLDAAGPQLDPRRQRIGTGARPIDLPCLRDLTIGDMSCLYAAHVLAHMHAPRVMSLSLMSLTGQDYGPLTEMLKGRFREVRMLQLQGFEVGKTDHNMQRAVAWFESMPRLKLLKFSRVRSYLLDALLADPRDYRPGEMDTRPADGKDDKRPVVCPELDTVHFNTQGPTDMSTFAKGRKDLGVMLKRVYALEAFLKTLKKEEDVRIRENVAELVPMNFPQMTREEDSIYEEMAKSLGVVRRR